MFKCTCKYGDFGIEVSDIVKSIYYPQIADETKKSVEKIMFLNGEDVNKIKKSTGLTEKI